MASTLLGSIITPFTDTLCPNNLIFLHRKQIFLRTKRDTKTSALQEYLLQMMTILFVIFREYCNVIHIDDYKFVFLPNEGDVHGSLEGFSYIHQSKGHFSIHECAPRSSEGCLLSVFRNDRDLIVYRESINHRHPR